MRKILLIAGLLLASCHSYSGESNLPDSKTEHDTYSGVTSSHNDMRVTEDSDYEACLREFGNHPQARERCDERFDAARPNGQDRRPNYYQPWGW